MNQTVLIGTVVEKFKLPNDDIFGIEVKCDQSYFIVHIPEKMYNEIDGSGHPLVGVKGHLYNFNNKMYVYADKLSIIDICANRDPLVSI